MNFNSLILNLDKNETNQIEVMKTVVDTSAAKSNIQIFLVLFKVYLTEERKELKK